MNTTRAGGALTALLLSMALLLAPGLVTTANAASAAEIRCQNSAISLGNAMGNQAKKQQNFDRKKKVKKKAKKQLKKAKKNNAPKAKVKKKKTKLKKANKRLKKARVQLRQARNAVPARAAAMRTACQPVVEVQAGAGSKADNPFAGIPILGDIFGSMFGGFLEMFDPGSFMDMFGDMGGFMDMFGDLGGFMDMFGDLGDFGDMFDLDQMMDLFLDLFDMFGDLGGLMDLFDPSSFLDMLGGLFGGFGGGLLGAR